jgi:cell pole-organizing protein PopZ
MTQPAKSQEPSMEEILASIRRIIADDDANKSVPRPAEPARPPVAAAAAPAMMPPRPAPAPPVAPPEPSPAEVEPEPELPEAAESGWDEADAVDQAADILDLTESMAAAMSSSADPDPYPAPSPAPDPQPSAQPRVAASQTPDAMPESVPQFRTIDGSFDVSYEETTERPAPGRSVSDGNDRAQLLSRETTAAVDSAFNTLAQTVLVQNARTLEDLVREMLRPMLKSWLDDNLPGMVERLVRAEIERVSRGRLG